MLNQLKNKSGLIILFLSLLVLFLLKLPLNMSVVCGNENQGFAFVWGQNLLEWKELALGRGLLFVLVYSIILKLFGFNSYSIIAMHILETLIQLLTGVLLFLIVKSLAKNNFFGGIATLIWVILITTPIGTDQIVEIRSHYYLSEESLIVFFSLLSIVFLIHGKFFNVNNKSELKPSEKASSFLAAFFTFCSILCKANGAILLIATICWFVALFVFNKNHFNCLRQQVLFYFLGLLFSILFFNIIISFLVDNLLRMWRDYFLIGSYTSEHLSSLLSLLQFSFKCLTRFTGSVSNFVLLVTFLLLCMYYVFLMVFRRQINPGLAGFLALISILGIGNFCVIIAPGAYQPYYYHLIWIVISILFSITLKIILDFLSARNKSRFIFLIWIVILLFFSLRIVKVIPAHMQLAKDLTNLSFFNQPQSFQDPPQSNTYENFQRPGFLQISDRINLLLPHESDTLYVFNLHGGGHTGLTPLTYIYSKRFPPTSVDCGLIRIPNVVESKLLRLKKDLIKRPPRLLIISEQNYIFSWQAEKFKPFLMWFDTFVKSNYTYETALDYIQAFNNNKLEKFNVFRKK